MRYGELPNLAPLIELAAKIKRDLPNANPEILWVDGCIDGKVTTADIHLSFRYHTPAGTMIFVSANIGSLEEWDQLFASIKSGERLEAGVA